jgi:probable HAF family extracellular repeat protein
MKSGKTFIFIKVSVLLLLSSSAFAYRPVINLGGTYSTPYSISDNGLIVGTNQNHAALFNSSVTGNIIDLKTFGGNMSKASSINNDGQIVGLAEEPLVHGSAYYHACLFDSTGNGANINLGSIGGTGFSAAFSINNNGQIVGYAPNSYNFLHACLFNSNGNIDLGALSGGAYSASYALSINDLGQIVGFASDNGDRATLFDATGHGANIKLSNYESRANCINDLGQIVGCTHSFGSNSSHACIFDYKNGTIIDLSPTMEGEALSINDLGQIVGYTSAGPCIFDPTGKGNNININTLIDPASGWSLSQANCINNNGWIIGQGTYHGVTTSFLLIPEPATILLFALGGFALRRRK